jgi:cytochrome c biogenesis factor
MEERILKTINIKGKEYVMVNERIKEFRLNEKYKNFALISEIVKLTDDEVVIKAIVYDENGLQKATGLAHEIQGSSMINKTSFIENCETSAWGRALGNLGIGVDNSIASFEEVDTAIKKQNLKITEDQKQKLTQYKVDLEEVRKYFKANTIDDILMVDAQRIITKKQYENLPEIKVE